MNSMGGQYLQLLFITENRCAVTLSFTMRKDTTSNDNKGNRYVKIVHQANLVSHMFIIDSRKIIDILKELTLGTDA